MEIFYVKNILPFLGLSLLIFIMKVVKIEKKLFTEVSR